MAVKGRCTLCGDTGSVRSVTGDEFCWKCYVGSPLPNESFVFEPGSELEIAVVPRCKNCLVELCAALDGVWTDEERDDLCFRCRRDPNRDVIPF